MSDDALFVGVDLNGVEDICAYFRRGPEAQTSWLRGWYPSTVILPRQRSERPLVGIAAAEAIEGRGWQWPEAARATSLSNSLRVPVIELLARVEGQDAATWQGPGGAPSVPIGDLLGAHVQECLPSGIRRCVVLAPDSLSELGQQRLLDGLRKVVPEPELLWRPIGVLLGWAERAEPETLRELHGADAVVVHLGFAGLEVSRLGLEAEDSSVGSLLVPVRRGRGQRYLSRVGLDLLQHVATQESRLLGGGEGLRWQLQWVSSHLWDLALGRSPREAILQDENGNWVFASGVVGRSSAFEEVGEDVTKELEHVLDVTSDGSARIGCILIEGSLIHCPVGEGALGETVSRLLAAQTAGRDPREAQPMQLDAGDAAKGAALYSWRLHNGLPTYYDVLPQLEINAIKELRAEFMPLVTRAGKVKGGQEYGPRRVPGFSVGANTSKLDYYLAKDDEPTVRLTETVVPEAPRETTAVDLVVTLKPGQGFATVEIRPRVRGSLGGRTVYLDWSTMKDTGETKARILRKLNEERGLAYPDPVPVQAHSFMWSYSGLGPRIEEFLQQRLSGKREYCVAAERLRGSLSIRLNIGGAKRGLINSDGQLPAGLDSLRRVNQASVEDLFAKLARKIEADFATLRHKRQVDDLETKIHRQLFLIASWCYTAAPRSVMQYLREVLQGENAVNKQYAVNAVGRTFHDQTDLQMFFSWCAQSFLRKPKAPFSRMRALVEILQYRKGAPHQLTGPQAYKFAEIARDVMEQKVEERNVRATFFKAASLLVALLRFRLVDPTFLDPHDAAHRALVGSVQSVLRRAQRSLPTGPKRDALATLLEQIEKYLERRGTDALLFQSLEAQAEGEDGEDG